MRCIASKLVLLPASFARLLIHLYQHTLSKALGPRCKYFPSCSHYADKAFEVHGFFKGSLLTLWRLLRCNPFSDGGVDYVPLKGTWTNPWTGPGSISDETYNLTPANAGVAEMKVTGVPSSAVQACAREEGLQPCH